MNIAAVCAHPDDAELLYAWKVHGCILVLRKEILLFVN